MFYCQSLLDKIFLEFQDHLNIPKFRVNCSNNNLFVPLPFIPNCLISPFLAFLTKNQKCINLFIFGSEEKAKNYFYEVQSWLGKYSSEIILFSKFFDNIYEHSIELGDINKVCNRFKAFSASLLLENSEDNSSIGISIITSIQALAERLFFAKNWISKTYVLIKKTKIQQQKLISILQESGYKRVNLVENIGEFSVKGSIIDFFSPLYEFPIRCDVFGDIIETLKFFSVETQRTIDQMNKCVIVPCNEILINNDLHNNVYNKIKDIITNISNDTSKEFLSHRFESAFEIGNELALKQILPIYKPGENFLWDFWNIEGVTVNVVFVDEISVLKAKLDEFINDLNLSYKKVINLSSLAAPSSYYYSWNELLNSLQNSVCDKFRVYEVQKFESVYKNSTSLTSTYVQPIISKIEQNFSSNFVHEIKRLLDDSYGIVIFIESEERYKSIKKLMQDSNILINLHYEKEPINIYPRQVIISNGNINEGFIHVQAKLAVFTENDIFGYKTKKGNKKKYVESDLINLDHLEIGDYLVHVDHGIAEFGGIVSKTYNGVTREYLVLNYAGSDRLYVPTDKLHKVQKYIGFEGIKPTIHSLNSKVWINQKKKAHENAQKVAKELLELYIKRKTQRGFAFLPDDEMQRKMEEEFPYVETADQLKAINDVKKDMESMMPMDRLICGDVGFGKTEVAIRAAFKAVLSGKQVAVLAPTTLLALQHYQTFCKRLKNFPVRIAMVSRLVKPSEQKKILWDLELGKIDIIIGTHRLLSLDVKFSDLGLLIIDEEHRFGVKHKEKIKMLKTDIDVLTLTATPIPRTLQMALSGIRQISIINTPPEDRKPVNTFVAPFDEKWIKYALIEELKRGGQVYYVYNRVDTIEKKAKFLQNLVPEARIAISHGQLDEHEIEQIMLDFINQKYDILLCTTIIESGLDLPNVNTLIVEEAERFGLAQLYQLRGRVGRSSKQAYAYLFYSKDKNLTPDAQKRLVTIEEYTALGSGFRIALRDLQIRGAGNILGEEQSGFIASVGFTLYMELLEKSISQLKGENNKVQVEASIDLPISAYIPKFFIPDDATRLEIYTKIAKSDTLDKLTDTYEECYDRFGNIPKEVEMLFKIARCRIKASSLGIIKVTKYLNELQFEFAKNSNIDPVKIMNAIKKTMFRKNIYFDPKNSEILCLKINNDDSDLIIETCESLLDTFLNHGL